LWGIVNCRERERERENKRKKKEDKSSFHPRAIINTFIFFYYGDGI